MRFRNLLAASALAMLLSTTGTFAQANTKAGAARAQSPPAKAKTSVATHTTRGKVTSLDANRLVLMPRGKGKKEMSFTLEGTTGKPVNLAVGDDVNVRYRSENNQAIATAVQQAGKKK